LQKTVHLYLKNRYYSFELYVRYKDIYRHGTQLSLPIHSSIEHGRYGIQVVSSQKFLIFEYWYAYRSACVIFCWELCVLCSLKERVY